MSKNSPVETRVEVIETKLEGLEKSVGVLITEVRKDREERHSQPRAIPFREIMITVAATVGVLATCATFAHQWVQLVTAVDRDRIARAERTLDAITKPTLK